MAFKVFLDANILLDLTLKRNNHEMARQVIELAEANRLQLYVSTSIVHILGHYLTKFYGYEKAKELLLELLIIVTVIDMHHEVASIALYSKINDIEDVLQYFTAIHHKMDYFITQDKKFKKEVLPVLPIYTTEEFLSIIL